jgi:sarcosine oxidase subunit alpha
MTSRRLPTGGSWIDRSNLLRFTFDGVEYAGFEGDTLASALLANGVNVVGASPILGRPRGVYSAGDEEPCAFVEVVAPWFDPIVAATMVELTEGMVADGRPGVGRLDRDSPSPKPAIHRHAQVDGLVVTRAQQRETFYLPPDGDARVWLTTPGSAGGSEADDRIQVLDRTTCLGLYDDGFAVLRQRGRDLDTIWHVRADRVTLATGAYERPIAFADNDRPGVMLADSARTYVERFGVRPGDRAAVFTTNHGAYDVADALREAGAEVVAIVDVAGGSAAERARQTGYEVLEGWAVTGTEGDPRLSAVHLAGPGGQRRTVEVDLLAVSGGWNPAVQLFRAIGGSLRYDESLATFVPDGSGLEWLEIVGGAAGDGLPTSVPYWYVPADDLSRHFVDLQRDASVADVLGAVGGGLRSVEHVKRATYIGTAIDQGRTSGVLAAEIVNQGLGWGLGAQGPSNARPPAVPVSYTAVAGPDRGPLLLDPVRTTAIHPRLIANGAVFENVGQWNRPWFFPRDGESMDDAVLRECGAVRSAAGVLDASTLGKIEVVGPDAAAFIDRMYTNRMSTLAGGSVRYGLMLGLDGMVFDDGVVMRIAEDRFFVTTTTGGAANVLDRFEEWLQTEWPELRVYCTSVTEQWATIAINGPAARDVVRSLGTDLDLEPQAFPFMTWRDGVVAGFPARVARVSFTGELAYEINVEAWFGLAMWEAVMAAGEPFGLTPYGTEAMHVLRAEKGFVIVGQDTDGTVTPHDLGMSWIVRKDDSDFVGRRSLARPDTIRPDRKQLVGLLPDDPAVRLPEGAQLVEPSDAGRTPPVPMLGHVTSSYRSAALERTFALAMVERGRERIGDQVVAPTLDGSPAIAATITAPVFYDPEGARRDD